MNIIELAKAEGLHIYPEHRSAFERFAAAVIKAHEAKLIEGVGEPHYWSQRMEDDTVNMVPFYYPEQLAAAVAKANQRIAELETLNHGLQNRNDHLQERIATLESTVKKAMDALNTVEWHGGGSCWIVDADAIDSAIKQIKEVLHAE